MRPLLFALVLAAAAGAQAKDEPKEVAGPEGRVRITVPGPWIEQPIAGTQILRVRAPGAYGGHQIMIVREAGQGDVDQQRDRYLTYDSPKYADGVVRKISTPYFGYRINSEKENRVFIRAFVSDGADGLVLTATSRLQHYDRLYVEMIADILASVALKGGTAGQPELEGEERRVFDPQGRASLLLPGVWKPLASAEDAVWIFAALKGSKSGPRFELKDWGGPSSAALTLTRIFATWKRSYTGISSTRLEGEPPRMVVRNRIPGSVDYFVGFEHRDRGFTLMLTVREGSYEKFRDLADSVAKTVVFTDAPYVEPEPPGVATAEEYKSLAVVHASSGLADAAKKATKELAGFFKHWRRIAPAKRKKPPPLRVWLVDDAAFKKTAHGFGTPPATYDRAARLVVALPPPADAGVLGDWRARVYGALTQAVLHRDLDCAAPPWLRWGLSACMDAAGRTGDSPEAAHPGYGPRVELKTATDAQLKLADVLALSEADFALAQKPDNPAHAYGYVHLMLYGRTTLGGHYKKWTKELEKAKREAPPFDVGSYDKAEEDLKKHAEKNWAKK